MAVADSGKVELTVRQSALRDLSNPVVRQQIDDKAKLDAQKTIARLRKRDREGR